MTTHNIIPIGTTDDAEPVSIDPSAIVSTRLMIQADSRQGKTSLLRLIAEGLLAQDRQVIVLDVEGEFATLRECGDVLVLGGDYGEAPIVPAAAPKIGELLASTTTSAVLDLLTMDPEDRDVFVANLLDWWVRMPQKFWRPKSPRVLLIDEVQELAPQSGKSESRPVIDKAMRLLAKRGFGVVPATQRLSSTSKGVVNVCRSNAVGPIAPKDAKDAADVLGIEARERHGLVRQELGTFTVRGAVFGHAEPVRVQVDQPQTSPPDPGDAPVTKARRGGIGKLVKAMQALQTKAEAVAAGDEDAETIDGLKAQFDAATCSNRRHRRPREDGTAGVPVQENPRHRELLRTPTTGRTVPRMDQTDFRGEQGHSASGRAVQVQCEGRGSPAHQRPQLRGGSMNTIRCNRCRQQRPADNFTPSALKDRAKGRGVVCIQCKSDAQTVARALRLAGDPGLMACYQEVLDRDLKDERGHGLLPDAVLSKRNQRIARYAARVEADGMAGDGRRFA